MQKLIIEVAEGYYKWLEIKKRENRASVAEITILDGKPYDERPHGEWIEVKEEVYYDYWTVCECSLCKHSWALGELSIEDIKDDYRFCPNCGADMRGGRT